MWQHSRVGGVLEFTVRVALLRELMAALKRKFSVLLPDSANQVHRINGSKPAMAASWTPGRWADVGKHSSRFRSKF